MLTDNTKLKRTIAKLAALIIIIAACFGFVWSGLPYKYFFKVDKVTGLEGSATYGQISLKWDRAKHASGYTVYEEVDGIPTPVEIVTGDCEITIDDYDREKPHRYTVAGWNNRQKSSDDTDGIDDEGELSDPVDVYYDKDKYAQKIPVLAYHDLIPGGVEPESSLGMPEDVFDEQMKYLKDNGFTTLTMAEFKEWHDGKKEFPVKSCVITFDDGYYGVYHLAYPIIKKYELNATAFLIGHHIGATTDDYDPKDEDGHYIGMDVIKNTRENYPGFEYESHTYNMHKRINGRKPVNVFSYEEMVEDCRKNREFGFRYMAYPWGKYNKNMQKALKQTGYDLAFAYGPYYYATRDDDPYAIDRIKVSSRDTIDHFKKIVDGEDEKYNKM